MLGYEHTFENYTQICEPIFTVNDITITLVSFEIIALQITMKIIIIVLLVRY